MSELFLCPIRRLFYNLRSLKEKVRIYFYLHSQNHQRDRQAFKEKTGFEIDDPIFQKYKWVPKDHSTLNAGGAYYTDGLNLYKAVNGKRLYELKQEVKKPIFIARSIRFLGKKRNQFPPSVGADRQTVFLN